MIFLKLFIVFTKIGTFNFGGGYAMLPILQREVVDNHHWATEEELMDYYALGQVTPGMIAVNVATFIGLKLKGFWGGIFATLGVITPSMIIITTIANMRYKTEMEVYQRLAREDGLTGMKNRRAFEEYLDNLEESAYTCKNVALFFMDLNKLKEINDSFSITQAMS